MALNNNLRDLAQGIPTRELVDGIQPARVGDDSLEAEMEQARAAAAPAASE